MSDMKTVEQTLTTWVRDGFAKAYPDLGDALDNVFAVPSGQSGFGDFQCNAAMSLARVLRKSPQEIANSAIKSFGEHEAVANIKVAGLGFINISLNLDWLGEHLARISSTDSLGVPNQGDGKTVVLDYSSPNVAKPMHIGHIRSTIIGNSLDRMYRFLGYHVVADNHIGDWGTQFGILIMGYRNFLDEAALKEAPVEELERLYVKSYEQTKTDEEWLDNCRKELVKLQSGDPDNVSQWEEFVRLSLEEFAHIYKRLDINFDHTRGESHYRDKLAGVVEKLTDKGLAVESDGALIVDLEEEGNKVAMVRKSDGGYNYMTSDVATVISRLDEYSPDRIIYVTDERQQLHFKQLFSIIDKLGIDADVQHVWFGLMRLPEGTFSTREGNVIRLERLLDEAEERALKIVQESSTDMSADQQKEVARAVGLGAVKYADLSQNPQTTVTFTWDKALALDGNSGPYLQYACARISSVMDKYTEQFPDGDLSAHPIKLVEPIERMLAVKLIHFPEVVERAANSFKPSALADYLYDLAQTYSTFYQNVPFLKAEEGVRESRIRICGIVSAILRKGLNLLGIETPERI